MKKHIYKTEDELAYALADAFLLFSKEERNHPATVALAGGNTPAIFFKKLSDKSFRDVIDWAGIHFFWSDERCVPPDHSESNYGMARKYLFDHVSMPIENIHRVLGENEPEKEAQRYASDIRQWVFCDQQGLPQFDWILLGLGADGHTASLFPGHEILYDNKSICRVSFHPESRQKRITMTMPLINNARRVTFLITGENKAPVVAKILGAKKPTGILPAGLVLPKTGILEYYMDEAAAKLI